MKNKISLTEEQIDRVIEMAWEDRTPFDAILSQFGLKEQDVIRLMPVSYTHLTLPTNREV